MSRVCFKASGAHGALDSLVSLALRVYASSSLHFAEASQIRRQGTSTVPPLNVEVRLRLLFGDLSMASRGLRIVALIRIH